MVVGILLSSEPFTTVYFGKKIILSNKTFPYVQNAKQYCRNDTRRKKSSPNWFPLQRASFNHFSRSFFLKCMSLFLSFKMLILLTKNKQKKIILSAMWRMSWGQWWKWKQGYVLGSYYLSTEMICLISMDLNNLNVCINCQKCTLFILYINIAWLE